MMSLIHHVLGIVRYTLGSVYYAMALAKIVSDLRQRDSS